jgi:apolipoprotein N-acyltransferase
MDILTRAVVMKAVSERSGYREKILILVAAAIGILSSVGENSIELTGLWSLVPLLWLEADSRRSAFFTVSVFYLTLSRGIVPGAYVFFRDGSLIRALTLWILSAAALAAPWGLLWSARSAVQRACGVVIALLASIPPPLGLIGWGHPLVGTGLFFPGFGWYGLVLMLVMYVGSALCMKLRRIFFGIALCASLCLDIPVIPEKISVGDLKILGLNTSFGRMASGSGDFDTQYRRERTIFQYIKDMEKNGELENADVTVLPETIIGRMNPTTLKRWKKFFEAFAQKGTVFIAGGEIPTDRGRKYSNVMVSFEKKGKSQTALQRYPVPFSMYRPFSNEGANAYLSSFGKVSIMEIQDRRLGFLVCYEQFLTWPFLSLLSQKPNVIIGPSNPWWCKDTSLPCIQAATVRLWARLFGVPVVICVNK